MSSRARWAGPGSATSGSGVAGAVPQGDGQLLVGDALQGADDLVEDRVERRLRVVVERLARRARCPTSSPPARHRRPRRPASEAAAAYCAPPGARRRGERAGVLAEQQLLDGARGPGRWPPAAPMASAVIGSVPATTSSTFSADVPKSTADMVRRSIAGPKPKAIVCRQAARVASHCARAASRAAGLGLAHSSSTAPTSSSASVAKVSYRGTITSAATSARSTSAGATAPDVTEPAGSDVAVELPVAAAVGASTPREPAAQRR